MKKKTDQLTFEIYIYCRRRLFKLYTKRGFVVITYKFVGNHLSMVLCLVLDLVLLLSPHFWPRFEFIIRPSFDSSISKFCWVKESLKLTEAKSKETSFFFCFEYSWLIYQNNRMNIGQCVESIVVELALLPSSSAALFSSLLCSVFAKLFVSLCICLLISVWL